tara:strand:- start:673 stop:1140 length:468 start_codon:yes stop_codon:yes gene_type:complete
MADEEFYLQVENEIKEGTKDVSLWSKAKVFAEENNSEPQFEYTKLRVEQLSRGDVKEKDDEFYLQVENEIKEGTKDVALWSKAKVFAEENNTEPQLEYTKLRVKQLSNADTKEKVVKVTTVVGKGVGGIAIILFFLFIIILAITFKEGTGLFRGY